MSVNATKAMVWYPFEDLQRFLNINDGTLANYHEKGLVDRMRVKDAPTVKGSLYGLPLAVFASLANGNIASVWSNKERLNANDADIIHFVPSYMCDEIKGLGIPPIENLSSLYQSAPLGTIRTVNGRSFTKTTRVDQMPLLFTKAEVNQLFARFASCPDEPLDTSEVTFEPEPVPEEIPEPQMSEAVRTFLKNVILARSIDDVRADAYSLLHPDA